MHALLRALLVSAVAVCALTVGLGAAGAQPPGGLRDKTVSLGSTYTITGQTGTVRAGAPRATGRVTLNGRWDGGRLRLLAQTTTAVEGRYRLTIHLRRRGKLELRLTTPDHRVARVVLTVI